ncbi:DUF4489 domain-containing protein [Anaeromicrobium sediminis]|uniref:DUF4489 domain-containing protein n=1 Tax=Anaeromicrobium sediminis TaxID=1478221 RepID=A0A267MJK0_9FIRM|nr:DUF4489 domain-containing protein [Anaeromicrobium sediminis]PAB59774.1 hypothetical protein CCE28_07395 [Anaeromicrobium sediminis]
MTYNNGYGEYETCKPNRDRAKCKPEHLKPQKILLECGEGTGSKTFTSSNDAPFQLAHVTLDTTCLNKSEILIKFSSLVKVERLNSGGTVRLKYELLRSCEDEEPIPLGTWMFEKVDISDSDFEDAAEESFNFIFCECSTCPSCCDYFVKVTPIEVTDVTATVSNGRMAALAQSLKDRSNHECKTHEPKYECTKYKTKFFESKETILECGNGNGSVIFRTENEPPVRIANVTIDTSGLCKPKVLIEFSSIVSYIEQTLPDNTVKLQFELFRRCHKEEPISRGVWAYEVGEIGGGIQSAQGFGFTFCECVNFSGCCEYFVILTPIEVPTGDPENAMISNSRMTALAQSSKAGDGNYGIIDCEPKHIKSKEILLECGSGTGRRTFTSSDDSAFQLAQVTIDTTQLCKPTINIEFSSIVSFERTNNDLNALLRYELFRVWDDGSEESQGVWVLTRVDQDTIKVTESFDFTFCESIICKSNCCTYFVKVTPIQIEEGQVTVSNGKMAALVQEE